MASGVRPRAEAAATHRAGRSSTAASGSRRGRDSGGRRRRGLAAARTPAAGRPSGGHTAGRPAPGAWAARPHSATPAGRPPCWGTARCAAATMAPSLRSPAPPALRLETPCLGVQASPYRRTTAAAAGSRRRKCRRRSRRDWMTAQRGRGHWGTGLGRLTYCRFLVLGWS